LSAQPIPHRPGNAMLAANRPPVNRQPATVAAKQRSRVMA
jgi:hypothetical protein